MQYRNILREYDFHVVLGEQQGQFTLPGDALQQADRFVCLRRRQARGWLIQQQQHRIGGQVRPSSSCFWLP
jgi:hypothetical protein